MDILTLAMAQAEVDKLKMSGGVGYAEVDSFIPKAEYSFVYGEGVGCYLTGFEKTTLSAHAKDGTILTVHFDGVDYKCKVSYLDGTLVAGNLSIIGAGENTGEPFIVADMTDIGGDGSVHTSFVILSTDTAEKHTVGISTETIHTIDPKYLLKVIDLDKYGIGQVILGLFASGGGTQTLENMGQFWFDIDTDKELRLEMNYTNFRFVIDQCARMLLGSGGVGQLSYSFMVNDPSSGIYTISVSITLVIREQFKDAIIAVKVS